MIKKLRLKIFLIIMVSLSTIVLGLIFIFATLNYKSNINASTVMLNRFSNLWMTKDFQKPPQIKPNNPTEKIEGVYDIIVEDSNLIEINDISKHPEIRNYAIKLSNSNKESGIIGKYIYRIRRFKDNSVNIMFLENEEAIYQIRLIFMFSAIFSVLALFIIYIAAKKMSKIIVKPVEESFEKQKQFISDASHELKTPLAVIEANVDVLENDVGNNKWMSYIQNEIQSMNKLINELLLLAKIENVDNVKEYQKFDLSKEVQILSSMFESMAFENKVTINSDIQENVLFKGYKEDIEHIVSTLMDNAIKHTKPNLKVEVELKQVKNEIILQVKNEGEPIPEEEREKIFERFYRIDKSRNRNQKRYGLGLAIAKSTVEKYNGKIEVLYKDNNTIFKVTLPN